MESNPSVLYSLDKRVSEKASRRLQKIGVSIVTNAKLSKMDEKGVYFTNGDKRDCDIVIWTGSVKANELTNNMPFKTEARSRIEADQNTNLGTNQENIFAIGDATVIYHPHTNQPTPWTARPAIMEGRIASNNIFQKILAVEGIAKEPKQYCYRHRQYPYIIPIGGKYAVAKIGPFVISGIFGWAFKGITELNYFLSHNATASSTQNLAERIFDIHQKRPAGIIISGYKGKKRHKYCGVFLFNLIPTSPVTGMYCRNFPSMNCSINISHIKIRGYLRYYDTP